MNIAKHLLVIPVNFWDTNYYDYHQQVHLQEHVSCQVGQTIQKFYENIQYIYVRIYNKDERKTHQTFSLLFIIGMLIPTVAVENFSRLFEANLSNKAFNIKFLSSWIEKPVSLVHMTYVG